MAHVRTYNPSVRVGNWNEDIQLEEDTLKDFLERRANGKLLIQRSSGLVGKMTSPVQLSTCSDGCVRFGDTVMIVNRGNPDRTVYGIGQYPRNDSALAMHMPDAEETDPNAPAAPVLVTGTTKLSPCFRTAFKIVPADDYAKCGDKLRYGQAFCLQTAEPEAGDLFLHSDVVLFNRSTEKSRHQIVQLIKKKSVNTHWQIEHKNPLLRLEYEHEPVVANDEIIFQHSMTHHGLCVEEQFFTPTLYGNEYEISAHTYLDSHKAEKPVNRWMIVLAVAGDPTYPLSLTMTGDQHPGDLQPSV
ncbi:hypothetical protein EGW08_012662 [Elysia chlorotica]|uniref:Cilia- and flagella-associated protein 161 n=1 Tax=Elysia chlorotica TaxID=188477 RepID=A0A433TDC7_ELYCH|nr:hypothetical protein EGW08_012662 [Elysia chlorotica]